ncbi:MipA/OmpV family protein [Caulobacter segnis]|uniref:MipA/OmpV family protein n=1 Tax=Caulobacter segnis TaxID=88688 RepID=UPI0028550267|nr:MipA/OmpV family protein [Caulobacter segnis]MDR6625879.1 outer membrane scaffolding protein for murein synthesis (MipA/OmpV family) [Caulobacter segnis]
MRIVRPTMLACVFAALNAGVTQAQETQADTSPHGVVAIGAGVVPEFDGSKDARVLPAVLADIRWGGVNFQVGGQGLRADIASGSRLAFGPVIGVRLPRDDADGRVGLLPEIDTAIEAGGFVGYRFGGNERGQGSLETELSVVHDVCAHDGLLATARASYAAIRGDTFSLSLDARTTWVNQDYARTYFGITPAEAVTSGLAAYRPGSGIRDVGVSMTAGYWFSPRFGVMGALGANYLIGDFADSPITAEGRRWQPTGALTIAYRF